MRCLSMKKVYHKSNEIVNDLIWLILQSVDKVSSIMLYFFHAVKVSCRVEMSLDKVKMESGACSAVCSVL